MTPSQLATANIRGELGRQRLARADLARALDESEMWLSRRLNDQVPLSIDDLVRIAAVLGKQPAHFIDPILLADAT